MIRICAGMATQTLLVQSHDESVVQLNEFLSIHSKCTGLHKHIGCDGQRSLDGLIREGRNGTQMRAAEGIIHFIFPQGSSTVHRFIMNRCWTVRNGTLRLRQRVRFDGQFGLCCAWMDRRMGDRTLPVVVIVQIQTNVEIIVQRLSTSFEAFVELLRGG